MSAIYNSLLEENPNQAIQIAQYIFKECQKDSKFDEKSYLNKTKNIRKSLEMFALFQISQCHKAFINRDEKEGLN
jgi:hypothetical protein